jgi:hypothetical protein
LEVYPQRDRGDPDEPEEHRAGVSRLDARFWQGLDLATEEMRRDAAARLEAQRMLVSGVEGFAIALSSSALAVALRSGSLIALMASSLPMWRQVDPLAILALSSAERGRLDRQRRKAEEDERRSGVAELLGTGTGVKAGRERRNDPEASSADDDPQQDS